MIKDYVIALDISSVSTGYAVFSKNANAIVEFGLISTKSSDCMGERLQSFEKSITSLLKKYPPEAVVVEEIFKGPNIKTFKTLSFFHGVAVKCVYSLTKKSPYMGMVSSIRKKMHAFFGKKMTGKEQVFSAFISLFGLDWTFNKYNDITDAFALLFFFLLSEEVINVELGLSVKVCNNEKPL